MSDQLGFPFAPTPKTFRAKRWGGIGADPEKRKRRLAKWRRENPDKAYNQQKRWRAKNPEKVRAQAARQYKKNRERFRTKNRRAQLKKYNLTVTEFSALLKAQDQCCAICCRRFEDLPAKLRIARVDHHHGTGQVRGLLCNACNTALGLLQDSPTLLRAAAKYIERDSQ